jgi:hypothetical protein
MTGVIEAVLFLGEFDATATGAEGDADSAEFVASHFSGVEVGAEEGFFNGGYSEWGGAGDVLAVLGLDVPGFVEVLYFAGDVDSDIGGFEASDGSETGDSFAGGVPKGVESIAIGADGSDSGDNDSAAHIVWVRIEGDSILPDFGSCLWLGLLKEMLAERR